jgi:alanyl aminopeptidase
MIRKMAAHASELLTARERIGLLGNVAALLGSGTLNGGDYLAIVGTLAQDPEPLVVNAAVSELRRVQMAFVPTELDEPFNAWVRKTLGPALDRFGIEKKPGESEVVALVRPRLLSWLGRAGRKDVLQHALKLAEAYMSDTTSIDPSLVGPALRLAAKQGDRELFETYKKHFEAARSPVDREQFLIALGAFQSPELRRAALAYAKEDTIRPNEIFTVGQGMSGDIGGRDLVFSWFTENYDFILERVPPMFTSFSPFVASGCSAERLQAATEFFNQASRNTPGVTKTLSRVSEQVNECVDLRTREGKAVAQFLTAEAG